MRIVSSVLSAAGLAALLAAAPAIAAPTLVIRHAALRIVVEPENRSDIAIDIYQPSRALPLEVRREGDVAIIDGHLVDWLTSCHGSGENLHALVLFRGDYSVQQMPQVQARVPLDAVIDSGGIVHGAVTRSSSLTLRHSGCGDWTVANVAGLLKASVSGVGDVRTGSAHAADVSLSGTGHIAVGAVDAQLTARVSGAGSVTARSAGSADLDMSGAGNVKIAGGHAPSVDAQVSGVGHVDFGGVADSLTANVSGVGDVDVAKVTGPIDQQVSGVGAVHVGGR